MTHLGYLGEVKVRDQVFALLTGPWVRREDVHVTVPGEFHGLRYVTVARTDGTLAPTAYVVDVVLGGVYPVPAAEDPLAACSRVCVGVAA